VSAVRRARDAGEPIDMPGCQVLKFTDRRCPAPAQASQRTVEWVLEHIYKPGDELHLFCVIPTGDVMLVTPEYNLPGVILPDEKEKQRAVRAARLPSVPGAWAAGGGLAACAALRRCSRAGALAPQEDEGKAMMVEHFSQLLQSKKVRSCVLVQGAATCCRSCAPHSAACVHQHRPAARVALI
jgi:hypothetical protein